MDVLVKFGDSRLPVAELFDSLPVRPVLRTLVQYLLEFCSQRESVGDVISGVAVESVGRLSVSNLVILGQIVLEMSHSFCDGRQMNERR